jgi:hypothetical protein
MVLVSRSVGCCVRPTGSGGDRRGTDSPLLGHRRESPFKRSSVNRNSHNSSSVSRSGEVGVWVDGRMEGNFQYQNCALARTLNVELRDSPLVAMGNRVCSFAYFFKGNVLQFEGPVGDHELLEAIRQNTLVAYVFKYGAEYVVSYVGRLRDYKHWTMLTPLPQFSSDPLHRRFCAGRQSCLDERPLQGPFSSGSGQAANLYVCYSGEQ